MHVAGAALVALVALVTQLVGLAAAYYHPICHACDRGALVVDLRDARDDSALVGVPVRLRSAACDAGLSACDSVTDHRGRAVLTFRLARCSRLVAPALLEARLASGVKALHRLMLPCDRAVDFWRLVLPASHAVSPPVARRRSPPLSAVIGVEESLIPTPSVSEGMPHQSTNASVAASRRHAAPSPITHFVTIFAFAVAIVVGTIALCSRDPATAQPRGEIERLFAMQPTPGPWRVELGSAQCDGSLSDVSTLRQVTNPMHLDSSVGAVLRDELRRGHVVFVHLARESP